MTRTITTLGILTVVVGIAFGVSAHFVIGPNATLDGPNLVVSWKEAGLGNNATAQYTASADGTAVYACINGGSKHPQASNKETVSGPVSATGTFSSDKNGNIIGSLTVGPPDPQGFTCPPGQDLLLAYVAYSNISLSNDTFHNTAPATPSSLSACLVSGNLASELCAVQ